MSILFGGAILLHILKLILKQVIFSKYDKIQINTDLQEISWSFFFKIYLPRILATTVMNLIYWCICRLVFGNYNDTLDMIGLIPYLIVDYFVFNWLLEDYITVSPIENNNSNDNESNDNENIEE